MIIPLNEFFNWSEECDMTKINQDDWKRVVQK